MRDHKQLATHLDFNELKGKKLSLRICFDGGGGFFGFWQKKTDKNEKVWVEEVDMSWKLKLFSIV